MNITKELVGGLVQAILDNQGPASDVLWCVTSFRTHAYCLFDHLGLATPGQTWDPEKFNAQYVANVLYDYASILTTFPAEVKYTNEHIETPRSNAVDQSLEIMNGLQSDDDSWGSAQELVRLVATNADSEHQKLNYTVLMGIVFRILMLLNISTGDICAACIEAASKKAE